jgi:hypothetical protein
MSKYDDEELDDYQEYKRPNRDRTKRSLKKFPKRLREERQNVKKTKRRVSKDNFSDEHTS